tara:strand:+ start:1080 stop:1661 length:582 start_codon:yes stop_codon:yes gene_type:complete
MKALLYPVQAFDEFHHFSEKNLNKICYTNASILAVLNAIPSVYNHPFLLDLGIGVLATLLMCIVGIYWIYEFFFFSLKVRLWSRVKQTGQRYELRKAFTFFNLNLVSILTLCAVFFGVTSLAFDFVISVQALGLFSIVLMILHLTMRLRIISKIKHIRKRRVLVVGLNIFLLLTFIYLFTLSLPGAMLYFLVF